MTYNSIAISGLPGSGKSVLIKSLSEELGWRVHPVGDFLRARHRKERPEITFEQYFERMPVEYSRELNKKLSEIVKKGEIITDTRYAHIFGPETLTVFVTAPLEVRARRAVDSKKYNGKPMNEIKTILSERGKAEASLGRKLWGDNYNYEDWKQYDIVLDSATMTIDDEKNSILEEIASAR